MTDARFLSNNFVICEANRVKFETLMQCWAYKIPLNSRNRSKGSPLRGNSLPKGGFFSYIGGTFPPPAPIEVKFCTAKRTQVLVGYAKFDVNRCDESSLRDEKPDFWSVSKFNTGSLPLCGILPVKTYKQHIFEPTASTHCTIFPILCMAIELVEAIKKVSIFFDPTHSFSYRVHGKFGLIDWRAVSQQ